MSKDELISSNPSCVYCKDPSEMGPYVKLFHGHLPVEIGRNDDRQWEASCNCMRCGSRSPQALGRSISDAIKKASELALKL